MGNLDRRLLRLEGHATPHRTPEVPVEVRIQLKAVERHQARERGEEPSAYTQEEIEAMREEDLEVIGGGGVVGILRDSAGWTSPESLEILDSWEEGARRRLERLEDGESPEVVYDDDEDEEERRGEWP